MRLRSSVEYGKDSGRGNVLCVQPYMLQSDYANPTYLCGKLERYLRAAQEQGLLNSKTVVVFPEYIGSWLVVCGEKRGVCTSPSVEGAMKLMVLSNPLSFARAYSSSRAKERVRDALFRMKAERMSDWYDTTFGVLAQEFRVTVVGGSIVLPSPKIVNGRLEVGGGPLYNVSVVYGPDGKALGVVYKAFPTSYEQGFTSAGRVEDIPVFDTPAGRLAVLVCADAWFPEVYRHLEQKKASVVVVPTYGMGDDSVLKQTWSGYSGFPNPPDVSKDDPGRITEREAFMKYSLPGRLLKSGIPYGATVCLRGRLWDIASHGTSVVVRKGKVSVAPEVDGAALVNVWL